MKWIRTQKWTVLLCLIFIFFACKKPKAPDLREQAASESLTAIHPGIPGTSPFWNTYSRRFIFAPAFEFKPVENASFYRFSATSKADGKSYVFDAQAPFASLKPIWNQLPVGKVDLKVTALDAKKQVIDSVGVREFYRAAVFSGSSHKAVMDYRESARRALAYLFHQPHYQNWLVNGRPDPGYELYCYPSKIIGAVVKSMLLYTNLAAPADAEKALQIAEKAATYLIHISEPAGAPLEYFPPTYAGDALSAKKYPGQIMLIYPAQVGEIYLDLYDKTQNEMYFQAAKNIAATFSKLQLSAGTWYLKIDSRSGEKVADNICVPIDMIRFFDRLDNQYDVHQYKEASKKAFQWIMENPMRTFNWEGQFEDVRPSRPYKNLTGGQANKVAIYLIDHAQENPQYIQLAEELVHFAEDQFLVWDKPMPQEKVHVEERILPCVLEQYFFYVPVDASVALMMAAFQKVYAATGKKLYLEKAVALANTMTVAQNAQSGRYPTIWERNKTGDTEEWLNCATLDAQVMINLAEFIDKRGL